ncbi:MAG: hypothetical protein FWG64_01885 [Firmicutes bacterium]|nr:hypothetical protein [Bacillota bacterium]
MNPPNLPELTFDEHRHIYKLNGAIIPSVTQMMRPLSNAYYGTIDKEILQKAANRGTAVHQAIENFLLYEIDDIEPEYENYYNAFKKWPVVNNPQVIRLSDGQVATENRVYHKIFRYAGTADLICEIDDKITLIDFKTSASIVDMLVKIQLAAYSHAYKSHGYEIEQQAIVHLKKDGTQKMLFYGNELTNTEFEVITALLQIQNYLKKETKK